MENIPKRLTVRKTEFLDAPLIVGLMKPVLYLPQAEIKDEDLTYILLHELTHYKRHDLLYKWFAMLVSSIHWFNPFVYIVSKQIDEECEVSCDYEVCKNLSELQKKDYMTMILDFVQTSIRKKSPLTTQMASNKKTLERRFIMIRTKKATSKLISVLSAVLAIAMLSTTVFASGVLSGLAEDNYTIEITNNGEVIELVNKPFIENGEVYVPLREMFEKIGIMELSNSNIIWKNGIIGLMGGISFINQNNLAEQDFSEGTIFVSPYYEIEIGKAQIVTNPSQKVLTAVQMKNAPVLKNGNTYIPYSYINYLLKNENWNVAYAVYDKDGNLIDSSYNLGVGTIITNPDSTVVYNSEDLKNPQSTINGFFEAFSDSNFALMKNYCTEKCRNHFFGDGYCFGMTKAELTLVRTDELYTNSNDVNALVTVNMTPHENSVFDPSQTSTSFYVCLLRQPDGRYLIDEFATGL